LIRRTIALVIGSIGGRRQGVPANHPGERSYAPQPCQLGPRATA
jgi:hypothetical protein